MNIRITVLLTGGLYLTLIASETFAHHSFAGSYDAGKTVEITGTVVDYQLRSPHTFIIVDVTKEDGSIEQWTVETNSANNVRRRGWDENTFKPGNVITVSGTPHRRPIPQLHGDEFTTATGTLEGPPRDELAKAYPPDPNARGFAGRWLPTPGQGPPRSERPPGSPLPLTLAGLEAWENYVSAHSPVTTCEPMNIPTLYHVGYLLDIRLNDEEVVFDHELYDVTRTVRFSAEPKFQEPSGRFGVAAARMEGDELVVESSGFPPSKWGLAVEVLQNGNGGDVPSSAQKRVTARYSVSEDGMILRVDYTVEDPVYLTEPFSDHREWTRVADDAPIRFPYNCDPDSASGFTGLALERELGQQEP